MNKYLHAPLASKGLPRGIPYIIGNEAAERFSFYGMRTILVVFMTQYLIGANGQVEAMAADEAKGWYHLFVSAVYLTPLLGALLSDSLLGKYRTIILLSVIYTLGHFALALDDTRTGLAIGLGLIALGAGGIKPCVSAHVGDQFGATNSHLLPRVFGWFYFSINLGALVSSLLTPWLLATYGAAVAFAIPGLLMLVATLIFRAGRHKFVHIKPGGMHFIRETFSKDGITALAKLGILYVFVAMFWALFDQTGSAWILQAKAMDRNIFGIELLPAQITAANPLLVMLLIPFFSYVVYPQIGKIIQLTPLRKIAIGMFITVLAFSIASLAQESIDHGNTPHISWQLLAYLALTSAEVMISITCLEFSYTQAPARMKSFIMAFFMMSIAAGNLFTSAVNFLIQSPDGSSKLAGADYYWFFTLAMLATSVLFLLVVKFYRQKTYLHDEHRPDVAGPVVVE
ncbi:MAG: POT family MFS transporter [Gammaproteobacteria bacterium]|jgi:POT family proton-dependent oligopeptide transporter